MTANTSANPITPAFTNGTLAGNTEVSKLNVHNLLYSGHTTKVLVHWIPWFTGGQDGTVNVNYSTSDPTYVTNFISDLISRGVDGVIVDWMGQTDITNSGALELQTKIQGRNSEQSAQMTFAIMCDAQLLGNYTGTNQARLLSALSYINSHYISDPAYLHYNSKPVIFDFGLTGDISSYGTGTIDWAAVQSTYPTWQWVHLDNATSTDGFGITSSAGSFLWVNPSTSGGNHNSDQSGFYTRAKTHSSQIAMGAAYKGFSNIGTDGTNFAPWDGSTRTYIDQGNGQTWLDSFNNINAAYSSSNQLPFLQLVTWDDYYEGTPLETGISGGVVMTPQMSLNITGNTNTIYDLELWYSSDGGTTYNMVGVYPSNTTTIPMPNVGKYFVKVASQPFCAIVLSNVITIS